MIASFFQSLNQHRVEYLLISGQAAVLYGAAVFSEDIDLWVNPTSENIDRFHAALRQNAASYYKLTPPFTKQHAQAGHGFHFTLGQHPQVYLDVMGKPPRVGAFSKSMADANQLDTDWGRLNVIGIPDLIALKKTQRLEDYPVISLLALKAMQAANHPPTGELFVWAFNNLFTIPAAKEFLETYPESPRYFEKDMAATLRLGIDEIRQEGDFTDSTEQALRQLMQARMNGLQERDRAYWKGVILDLKRLRNAGAILPEGAPV